MTPSGDLSWRYACSSRMLSARHSSRYCVRANTPPAPRLSDRLFIEAVLYQARTGTPWRDLPDEFGHWNAVYQRFRRWEKRHLRARLWQQRQQGDDEPLKEVFIDSTILRAHQHAAGAVKKRWPGGPGSRPLPGWVLHQAARGLCQRNNRCVLRVDGWRAP